MARVLVCVVTSLALASTGASGVADRVPPTLRVGTAQTLTIVGAGFRPRIVVRVRVRGMRIDRRASVRPGRAGGFTVRFAGLARCSPDRVTATAADGARARVPSAWFVRECPPPPPLQPGTSAG